MNGLILLPTLNRTELLKSFIKSYIETEATVDVWVLVDEVDYQTNRAGYELALKDAPETIQLHLTDTAVTMGDKIRKVYPQITPAVKWIGLLNDDHYCITPEWDKKAESLLDGTNMVSTNDGFWNFGVRVVGLTAWSKPLLDLVGFPIYPENLQHLYIDDVWKAIGESSGCWHETMSINIEHRHVYAGKMAEDDTFKKVNSQSSYQSDLQHFQKFMEQDFKIICQKILDFRASQVQSNKFV